MRTASSHASPLPGAWSLPRSNPEKNRSLERFMNKSSSGRGGREPADRYAVARGGSPEREARDDASAATARGSAARAPARREAPPDARRRFASTCIGSAPAPRTATRPRRKRSAARARCARASVLLYLLCSFIFLLRPRVRVYTLDALPLRLSDRRVASRRAGPRRDVQPRFERSPRVYDIHGRVRAIRKRGEGSRLREERHRGTVSNVLAVPHTSALAC